MSGQTRCNQRSLSRGFTKVETSRRIASRHRLLLWLVARGVFLGLPYLQAPPAQAAPADPIVRSFSQPNGTTFQARVRGDEWLQWVETRGGHPALQRTHHRVWSPE